MTDAVLLEQFRDICRMRGWKFTSQRFAVYCHMHGNAAHPTADMVRHALLPDYPGISRDSVFRILNNLAESGVIVRMPQTDPVRFDGNPGRHDHFFCLHCGRIVDFKVEIPVAALPETVGELHGLALRADGLCRDCLSRSKK